MENSVRQIAHSVNFSDDGDSGEKVSFGRDWSTLFFSPLFAAATGGGGD